MRFEIDNMKEKYFRCLGKNKKNKTCNQLLFKYKITKDEMIIQIKCGSCNTFSVLRLPFKKENEINQK